MKTHYETLGISPTSTKEEVKAAFRKLSLETHPDLNPGRVHAERFKLISEAHNVLSDDLQRRKYDLELRSDPFQDLRRGGDPESYREDWRQRREFNKQFARRMSTLEGIYHPRNLLIGITLGLTVTSLIRSYFFEDETNKLERTGMKQTVEAWKNPRTGNWEQPAPWDPYYRKLKPELHWMPRDQVRRTDRK